MTAIRYDVLGLGNAIVDVIARTEEDFLVLRKPYEMADLGRSLSRVIAKSTLNEASNVIVLPRRPSA